MGSIQKSCGNPCNLVVILRTATNPSFFDGRLDDNNMKDVMTEMIPFASLAPLRLRVKSRTQRRKERKSQFMPVSSIYIYGSSVIRVANIS